MQSKDKQDLYKQLFATPTGRSVLKDLMEHTRTGQTVFHPDPYRNAFNQGMQDVGNYIKQQLEDQTNGRSSTSNSDSYGGEPVTRHPDRGPSGSDSPGAHTHAHPGHGRIIP